MKLTKKLSINNLKKTDLKYRSSKETFVNYIFNYYKNTIAVENDKEEFTSSNYIFWITNNLFGMYSQTSKKGLGKLIEGPCHNKSGNKITKKIVEDTHKHVRKFLMKMPNKDLYALIGYGLYNH